MEKRKSGRVVVKKKVVTEWVDFSVTPYCRRNFQKFETFWAARRENPECGLSCLDLHCQFLCFRQSVVHVEGLCSKAVPHWRGGGETANCLMRLWGICQQFTAIDKCDFCPLFRNKPFRRVFWLSFSRKQQQSDPCWMERDLFCALLSDV